MIRISHGGNAGDTIYSLPSMRKASRLHGQKIEVILHINQKGVYTEGHPLGEVMLNQKMAEMLTPLLESMDFIGGVQITEEPGEIDYNFDLFRKLGHNYTGHISKWYHYVYPELTCDLSEPIYIPGEAKSDRIIFNRTQRYHGENFDYLFLKDYGPEMLFVGLESEYNIIRRKLPGMEYRPVKDFLELAQLIKGSRFFCGNQSMAFALAEIMKVPRVVEICRFAHNVIPTGANGYEAFDILNLKRIFEILNDSRRSKKSEPELSV